MKFMVKYHSIGKRALILVLLTLKEGKLSTKCKKNSNCSGFDRNIDHMKEFAPNLNEL